MANRRSFGSNNFGSGGGNAGGSNFNQGNRGNYLLGAGLAGVSPWQSGNSPNRTSGNSTVPSLLATNNILNQLTTDSPIALATKLLTTILPVQQQQQREQHQYENFNQTPLDQLEKNRSTLNSLVGRASEPSKTTMLATGQSIAPLLSAISINKNQQPPSLMSLNNSFGGTGNRFGGGGFGGGDRFRRNDKRTDNFRNRRQANDRNKDRKGGDNKTWSDKTKAKSNEKGKKEGKDDDNERKDDDEKGEKTEDESQKQRDEGPLPEYENVPAKLFHCHVCGKTMWNDVSYDTHIKGRNHRNKLRDLEENYQMQTDLMRQIAAMSLKLEELRRGGKRRPYPDQYCKMCDLHFNGMTMFAHRSTSEHQNLKRFIHPSCEMCKIDFQVRIEYDEHILTAQHLQQEAKALLRKEKVEKDPFYVKLREQEVQLSSILTDAVDVKEKGDVVLTEEDKNLIKTVLAENETLPEYDPDAETLVAEHFVIPQSGFFCKACKLFILSSESVDVHCRTVSHYNKYIETLKAEANKLQKEEGDGDTEKRKSDSNEDTSGNWKRRKVDSKNSELNGGKKYDPEETLDESLDDYTSETSEGAATGKTPAAETKDDKSPKSSMTTRRGRGRATRK